VKCARNTRFTELERRAQGVADRGADDGADSAARAGIKVLVRHPVRFRAEKATWA
jgi:hypothetical protein